MKAECTWEDGPDILLSLDGTPLILHENPSDHEKFINGVVKNGSADLTVNQARDLVFSLQVAIGTVEHLENQAKDYSNKYKEHRDARKQSVEGC